MEAALNGLSCSSKHAATKEAIVQAKEAVSNGREKGDVPVPYIREKCLAAIELAFDHGSEKGSHYAVEAVQALLRDQRFHSISMENPQHNLPTQVLHSMTGIAQWSQQLQCHCLTLLVEMICSTELRISLQEVEEALELCMRVFGASREESVRVSARAAVSQSISSYLSNRYAAGEESQDLIAVYLDVTKLLEYYIAKLDQMTASNDQSVVVYDATTALLSAQPLTIRTHVPFVNLLWEKLCPLMIRQLGVPDKNVTTTVTVTTEEPVGQAQMSKYPLSPAVIANPEATRALYQILEQLIRLMSGIPSVSSVLEALFHKAFLYPKIEQRTEAIKIIRKVVSDPLRVADLVSWAARGRSLSLWRMIVVCLLESSTPNYEISIDAVRTCGSMLQGILDFSRSTQLLNETTRQQLREMFESLEAATTTSFTARSDVGSSSPRPSTDSRRTESETEPPPSEPQNENDDEMSATLKKLSAKFGVRDSSDDIVKCPAKPILQRRSTEYDETSEKVTARKFVDSLLERLEDWKTLRSTLNVDHAIIEFAASFYSDFSAVHNEVFKSKSKVQQEFLNTDAIYLTAYAALSLHLRGKETVTWERFKFWVLCSGCVIYVSESWLQKVFDHVTSSSVESADIKGPLKDVIRDFDGFEAKLLSDVERLQIISEGPAKPHPYEERLACRWFITSAWDSIVSILSTFLGIKDRRRTRQKIVEGIEHSINGMQLLATVALELELGARCGWIFENLVETSCDVEQLRQVGSAEETKRWSSVCRVDLLSIQMVLDNAFVAIHAPECWKHVIRCTEFVWELEKFMFGSLCYEKPSRFSFGRKKVEPKQENKAEEGLSWAERSVERALGEREPDKDNINKALAVLIAKVDRFYSQCGRNLDLRALKQLFVCLVGASENRIFYSGQKDVSLTPAVNLLGRISEVMSCLPPRPLVHQMIIWPVVADHFVQVSCCQDESRCGVEALVDSANAMLTAESNGMCVNQMLLAPFQAIVCRDMCSNETPEQLVSSLADFVKEKSDTLGSGWKPLFGTLKAVRTSTVEDASVHWTVIDVIGTYLRINSSSVLSWSLPDCFPCIVHFLQSTHSGSCNELDAQLSEAALRLIQPVYSVILNLYRTPHIPNHNLLHRCDLRSGSMEEVEGGLQSLESTLSWLPPMSCLVDPALYPAAVPPTQLDCQLDVPFGPFPWMEKSNHETASTELLLSLVEQLSGTLVTSPAQIQPPLLRTIQQLLNTIKNSDFGLDTAAFCVSALLLPHVQKWLRRHSDDDDRNLKQAVGTCTQIVCEFTEGNETSAWSTRLLSDACRLSAECCALSRSLSGVGVACLRHLSGSCHRFEAEQWTVLHKTIWDACAATLHPVRLLNSLVSSGELPSEANGDVTVLVAGSGGLPIREKVLAQQVLLVESQRNDASSDDDDPTEDEGTGDVTIVMIKQETKFRLPLSVLISSLLSHQQLLHLLSSLLSTERRITQISNIDGASERIQALRTMPEYSRTMMYYTLDASYQVALDVDSRPGVISLLSKSTGLSNPNLYKQLVSAALIKLQAAYQVALDGSTDSLNQLTSFLECSIRDLKRVELATAKRRVKHAWREHKEQKLEFMLVEKDGEKLYKVVNENEINSTIEEYQRQRPIGAQPIKERKNPFNNAMSTDNKDDTKADADTWRLLAYRDICLTAVRMVLDSGRSSGDAVSPVPPLLHPLLPTISQLVLASPDLTIRQLAVDIIRILGDQSP